MDGFGRETNPRKKQRCYMCKENTKRLYELRLIGIEQKIGMDNLEQILATKNHRMKHFQMDEVVLDPQHLCATNNMNLTNFEPGEILASIQWA